MKKVLAVLLSVLMLCAMLPAGMVSVSADTAEFAGGSGTAEDPYLVATKEHLNNVRNHLSSHFKMTADIIFTEEDYAVGGAFYNDGKGWEPIGNSKKSFAGNFDGDHHTIYGLTITYETGVGIGLFGYISSATIRNIRLHNADILGCVYVGGICGYATTGSSDTSSNAIIKGCYVDGSIIATDTYVGGICGIGSGYKSYYSPFAVLAEMTECYNSADVKGKDRVGGIIGCLDAFSRVSQCVNEGKVVDTNGSSGGIAGVMVGYSGNGMYYYSYIYNSINKGEVPDGGGLVGKAQGATTGANVASCCQVSYCYDIYKTWKYSGGAGETAVHSLAVDGADALSKQETFENWNFNTTWTMEGDPTYPYPELQCFTLQGETEIEGEVRVGKTLTASFMNSSAYPVPVTYAWYVDDVLVGTDATYAPTIEDVGKSVRVCAVGADVMCAGQVSSEPYVVGYCAYSEVVQHSVMDTTDGTGLAFRFELLANGVGVKNRCEADLTNATVNYLGTDCKLMSMGVVLTNDAAVGEVVFTLDDVNGVTVLDVPTVYLQDVGEDYCAFATRIINIPDTQLERTIYARPYYVVEVDGEQITVYGDVDSASCAEYM